jgi:hypothetical protein
MLDQNIFSLSDNEALVSLQCVDIRLSDMVAREIYKTEPYRVLFERLPFEAALELSIQHGMKEVLDYIKLKDQMRWLSQGMIVFDTSNKQKSPPIKR